MKVSEVQITNFQLQQLFEEFNSRLTVDGINAKYSWFMYKNSEAMAPLYSQLMGELYDERKEPDFPAMFSEGQVLIEKYRDRDAEGKEITLEDTLIDDRVDIEAQVYDGMVKDIYKREIEKYIDGKKLDVCILRWFNNCSYKYISTVTEINNVSGILMDARATLIRRSPLLRAEFFKLHGMDSYSDAARVVI